MFFDKRFFLPLLQSLSIPFHLNFFIFISNLPSFSFPIFHHFHFQSSIDSNYLITFWNFLTHIHFFTSEQTLLIVLPLLALVTQQTTIYAEIVVSYVVALHIWFIVCELFIFMALFELAFALIYVRSVDEKKEKEKHEDLEAVKSQKQLRSGGHLLDVHDLERRLGIGKKFKYDFTKPDGEHQVPGSPSHSDRSFGRNSLTASHMIKTALNHVYGNVDWRKSPQDRNKIDYVSRILFPVMFFFFVALYAIALH